MLLLGPYSCSIYSPSLRSPGSGMIDNVQFITGYAEICVDTLTFQYVGME